MATLSVDIVTTKLVTELTGGGQRISAIPAAKPRELCNAVANLLERIAGGMDVAATLTVQASSTSATKSSGTVTIASGSGSITATINGVAIAITWATSDTNSALLLAAAINASTNALVTGIVTATSALGVVTISSVDATKVANAITLTASGTGATASGTGRLTGGGGHDVAATTYVRT